MMTLEQSPVCWLLVQDSNVHAFRIQEPTETQKRVATEYMREWIPVFRKYRFKPTPKVEERNLITTLAMLRAWEEMAVAGRSRGSMLVASTIEMCINQLKESLKADVNFQRLLSISKTQ